MPISPSVLRKRRAEKRAKAKAVLAKIKAEQEKALEPVVELKKDKKVTKGKKSTLMST